MVGGEALGRACAQAVSAAMIWGRRERSGSGLMAEPSRARV
jgi:hypothetical protein